MVFRTDIYYFITIEIEYRVLLPWCILIVLIFIQIGDSTGNTGHFDNMSMLRFFFHFFKNIYCLLYLLSATLYIIKSDVYRFSLDVTYWMCMLICVIIVIGVNILGKFLCPRDRWWRDAVLSCMSLCNSFQNSVWNFSLAYNFSTMKAKALIFHISIPCVKAFLCEPTIYTSWPWPFHFTYFLKTLTLLITFKPWVLEHW